LRHDLAGGAGYTACNQSRTSDRSPAKRVTGRNARRTSAGSFDFWLTRCNPTHSLADAVGTDFKGRVSILVHVVATPLALILPLVAFALYVVVAVTWIVPDRRMERSLAAAAAPDR